MKIRTFFQNVGKFISRMWTKADQIVDKTIPVLVFLLEGIKKATDSPIYDGGIALIKLSIKGTADDVIIDKANEFIDNKLPLVILKLKIANDISDISDPKAQVIAVLKLLKVSDSATRTEAYQEILTEAGKYIVNGLTFEEIANLVVSASKYYEANIKV